MKKYKKYIEEHLESVREISTNIIQGDFSFNGKVVATYVFDFNPDAKPGYLEEVNERVLSDIYYSLSGDLQWNLYYVLLDDNTSDDLVKAFELDKSFARKKVVNSKQFLKFFEKINFESNNDRGLYDIWKNTLEENGMSFVGEASVSIAEGVRRISNGVVVSTAVKPKKKNTNEILSIDRVHSLVEWDKTRLACKIPLFGKINLISGPNAVGKTSLLEFIEMGICGGSYRNPDTSASFKLKIKFNENQIDEYQPKNKEKYRERDSSWYNSVGSLRQNTLPTNFGRYNFYDADASYRISHENEREGDKSSNSSLLDALSQVALGKEMNELDVRVKAYKERVETEARRDKRSKDEVESSITKHNDGLKKISKTVFDEKKAFADIYSKLEKEGWIIDKDEYEQDLIKLSDDINYMVDTLDSLIDIGGPLHVSGISSLEKLEGEILRLRELIKEQSSSVGSLSKASETQNKEYSTIMSVLNQFAKYESILDFEGGLDFKVKSDSAAILNKKSENISNANAVFILGFDAIDEKHNSELFLSFIDSVSEKERSLNKSLNSTKKRIESLTETENSVGAIVEKLKQLGLEYINVSSSDDKCPLCLTQFEKGKLKAEIIKEVSNLSVINEINSLNKDKKLLDKEIKNINSLSISLSSLREAYLDLFTIQPLEKFTVLQVKDLVFKEFESLKDIEKEYKVLMNDLGKMAKSGISSKEFLEFSKLVQKEIKVLVEEKSREKIVSWIKKMDKNKTALLDKITKTKIEVARIDSALKKEFKQHGIESSIEDLEAFEDWADKVQNLRFDIEEGLLSHLNVGDTSFKVLRNKFGTLKDKCVEFIKSKREHESNIAILNNHAAEIKKLDKKLKDLEGVVKNYNKALEILASLLKDHSKEGALEHFLERNISSIKETYLRVHSPQEFSDVTYDHDEKMIFLTRVESGSRVTASQISSGQRAALALSVFLTLNQNIATGPKVILFDDPVIFADDLNVLSFFDYLRVLAIEGHRQIFFATANEKIAALFRRKFRILGDDFVDISLDPLSEDESKIA